MLTLHRWRGAWWKWDGSVWVEYEDADMRAWLYRKLERKQYLHVDGRSGIGEPRAWAPNRPKVGNLSEAVEAITILPSVTEAPMWTDGREHSGLVIPCRNGLLDMGTRTLLPASPSFFNTSAVPFDYAPDAPEPAGWLEFLASVWPGDPDAVAALQEMFGYVISGRRDLEKIFLIVGPKRSGKGTIATVLTALVGEAHTAGPTLAGLATNFGMADLIGKTLAIVPDARMPRDGAGLIVERLLMISGRDRVTVDRKHRDAWNGRLPVQFLIMSNELPSLPDAAAAIAGRLIVLRMAESFYGREDSGLKDRLLAELPGIFLWALAGLDRVTERGRFAEPESSAEAVELLQESTSPIGAFLAEKCVMEPEATVTVDALWEAWRLWCNASGRDQPGVKSTFGRLLFAAAPKVKRGKLRSYSGGPQVPTYFGVRLG